jgi:hypothetical protein
MPNMPTMPNMPDMPIQEGPYIPLQVGPVGMPNMQMGKAAHQMAAQTAHAIG